MQHTCIQCGNEIQLNKKYCNESCRYQYRKTHDKLNTLNYKYQHDRGITRKLIAIKSKGSQCESCGYSKNISALAFHHIDPTKKTFSLDSRSFSNRSIDIILSELENTKLLYHNCHMELHYPELDTSVLLLNCPS